MKKGHTLLVNKSCEFFNYFLDKLLFYSLKNSSIVYGICCTLIPTYFIFLSFISPQYDSLVKLVN